MPKFETNLLGRTVRLTDYFLDMNPPTSPLLKLRGTVGEIVATMVEDDGRLYVGISFGSTYIVKSMAGLGTEFEFAEEISIDEIQRIGDEAAEIAATMDAIAGEDL